MREINANSEPAQSLFIQPSVAASNSLQEEVENIIAKEKENASKLSALKEIQHELMATAEEQQCLLEEAQFNLLTLQTSVVESKSEAESSGGARPKKTQRVTIKSPQVRAVSSQ